MLFSKDITSLLLIIPPLLFSLTVHEFSHALAATLLGDTTAKDQGRLSLNPIRHLDFLGTLMILMSFFIGWAKPVPVDPRRFRHPKRDMSIVAAAGPASNFVCVLLSALILNFVIPSAFFLKMPDFFRSPLGAMVYMAFFLTIGLCFFNLLPIPPLAGFNVVSFFLPDSVSWFLLQNRLIFFIILIVLIALGAVRVVLNPVFEFFASTLLSPGWQM